MKNIFYYKVVVFHGINNTSEYDFTTLKETEKEKDFCKIYEVCESESI